MNLQEWIERNLTTWVTNPIAWNSPGPWVQMFGAALLLMTLLQMLPNSWAGGRLFDQKAAWATYIADAVYLFVLLVIPWLNTAQLVGMIIVAILLTMAFIARRRWNRPLKRRQP